jgi:prefoldin subunit 2
MSGEGSSSSERREPQTQNEVLQMFQSMRQEVGQMSDKINELDNELTEHELVLSALEPMDKDRKCFRQIGAPPFRSTAQQSAA